MKEFVARVSAGSRVGLVFYNDGWYGVERYNRDNAWDCCYAEYCDSAE